MLYTEFMNKAAAATIVVDDINGLSYLLPSYRKILDEEGLHVEDVTDWELDICQVREYLDLFVNMLNKRMDSAPILKDWIANIITNDVDPAVTDAENDFVKNVLEYLKLNEELKSKKDKLHEIENKEVSQQKQKRFTDMNFSKREIE